ncbi:hypothetical protein [Hymenobacter jeollabukensis]|uniref:Glycosyltransferase RgtA/B/C/D-like domain-containing protein n=1 Tax=Hymenobacter jeollabukensis TaxID=2025313 RepID=A0A5R8WMS8_9BACT|nr:hypothetical protein [Hymenobacter jeollabukensis]TLM90558.1 hypothetical protein FDY95_17745 [Hymenobacter jeollabukensis]
MIFADSLAIPRLPAPSSPAPAERRLALRLTLAGLLVSVLTAFLTGNTYDLGDSINHYLFSRYAPAHPDNFFDSWAKPVFVLLTVLPSQAGFIGIKLFNCVVAALAAWQAYRVAAGLRLRWPWLAVLFVYCTPDYFRIQFSGLTEPLFSLLLVSGAALTVRNRATAAAIVLSFLPFVRSEGFLILAVWAVYLVLTRQWRVLPWLPFGYVVYSVAGAVVYRDLGWVFHRNAYETISHYGAGRWGHFVQQLPGILGWVLLGLFWLGMLAGVLNWLTARDAARPPAYRWAERLLVYGSVVTYLGAHTVFWALGLFASFGMTRVMDAVVPLMTVIALQGLALLTSLAPEPRRAAVAYVLAAAVLVFPLTGARTGFRWRTDFSRPAEQQLIEDVAAQLQPRTAGRLLLWDHPYWSVGLGIDPFDSTRHQLLDTWRENKPVPAGTLLLWDNWFSPTEARVSYGQLRQDARLRLVREDSVQRDARKPEKGYTRLAVFERR